MEFVDSYSPWLNLEKAKALYYLGCYEEAYQTLELFIMPDLHHPIDLSFLYIKESYQALLLMKFGKKEEAITAAQKAVENFEPLLDSKMKEFSRKVLEQVSG